VWRYLEANRILSSSSDAQGEGNNNLLERFPLRAALMLYLW
jgi:hypothetical protein